MQTDLLTRLSTATIGSRELDAEVALALGWRCEKSRGYEPQNDYAVRWYMPKGQVYSLSGPPPPLTTSLDAIVGEIERRLPGWPWLVTNRSYIDGVWQEGKGKGSLKLPGSPGWMIDGNAPHPLPRPLHRTAQGPRQ